MYRSFLVLIIVFAVVGGFGCKKAEVANANAEPTAETGAPSPFAAITDPAAAVVEGDRLFDDNQTELAIAAYKRAVELDPDLAEAYFKMGVAYALIETEAVRTGTSDYVPGEVVGNKLVKTDSTKMFEKAVVAYKKLLAKTPDDPVANFNLGRALNKLNKDEDAEKALEKAVKLKPDDVEYLNELGLIQIKLAKYHEAVKVLKKAFELDPENAETEEALEEATAGARRIDYNNPANTNTAARSNSNANVNANTASNSNSATKPPSNTKVEPPKSGKDPKPTPKPAPKRN
ncbi:MAG TPA: tetratricopeptide repeat protein [Pyrinomonadaceae bacterium]|nr:tetratricopeptide repeat protein [Pyrinomonadaceae bacterium]